VNQLLSEYYRIPSNSFTSTVATPDGTVGSRGFFHFGNGIVCYGRSQTGVASNALNAERSDASKEIHYDGGTLRLPFDFIEVIDNLRLERYREMATRGKSKLVANNQIRDLYYFLRKWLPIPIRRRIQKAYFYGWKGLSFPAWPVDFTVDRLHDELLRLMMQANGITKIPFIWFWPEGAPSCLMVTHDVETSAGLASTSQLMDLDDSYGIRASFQVIPEGRYNISDQYVKEIRSRGFEFNLHDLNHDGQLYRSRPEFLRRAAKINRYLHQYDCQGFRAGAMYRNQEWYDAFEFSYDMSVPNVAHLEPMRGGCCTVMPYFVGKVVELPLTLAQDYSLFFILNDYSTSLWEQQLALIQERNGLISLITHPDYLIERRARKVYEKLVEKLSELITKDRIWAALPGEVDRWWRARSQMTLVSRGDEWEVEGPESSRARLAFAVLDQGRLVYELAGVSSRKKKVLR